MGCHFLLQCMKVKSETEVTQSCLTLSDPMDCSLPGSSVHGIFQAGLLEWGAIAFSAETLYCMLKFSVLVLSRNMNNPHDGSDSKESACNAGDLGSIPGSGRSPGEGNSYPLQYSRLESSMDREAWWTTAHRVTNKSDMTERLTLHFHLINVGLFIFLIPSQSP